MILGPVDDKDMYIESDIPVLNLCELNISSEHYDAVEKVVKELRRQGLEIKIVKE